MTDVFYSISPYGTGDIQTGSGNISIASGVATIPAQTGNIGVGCAIEYLSTVVYISAVNSPTSFDVITATGATPSDQGSTSLTSIHHVWASLTDAEANYLGANFLNTTNLVTGTFNPYFCCYYDHDDQTVDSSIFTISGATTNATYFLTIFTPQGGTESINDQRHDGKYNTNKFLHEASSGSNVGLIRNRQVTYFDGVQMRNITATAGQPVLLQQIAGSMSEITNSLFIGSNDGLGISIASSGGDINLINSILYQIGATQSFNRGILCNSVGATITIQYCTIYNFARGVENITGTITAMNTIVFGSVATRDFTGTITVDYCATEDGDGTNAVTLIDGTYAYSNIWTDYSGTPSDFSLANDTTDTNAPQNKGVDIPAITVDILGVTRGDPSDIGAFEFLTAAGDTLTAADGFEFSDSIGMTAAVNMGMSDGFKISDTVGLVAAGNMNMSDGFEFSDTFLNTVSGLLTLSDSFEFSDTFQNVGSLLMSLSDTAVFSDSVSLQSGNFMNLADGFKFADSLSLDTGTITLTLNDGFKFSDAVSAVSSAVMGLEDGFVLSDTLSLNTGELVEGPIKITVSTKQAKFDIIIKQPEIETSIKQPKFNIEVN